MIYELLRRDPAWSFMPLAAALSGLCMLVFSGDAGFYVMVFAPLLYIFLSRAEFRRRATLFQAALPISARDLIMARCLTLAALVWLPMLAAAGVSFIKGNTVLTPIDCGAGATLFTIAILSCRLTEVEAPPSSVMLLLPLAAGLGVLAFDSLPAASVLTFCALASVALLVRAWRVMPASFQVAPVEAQRAPSVGTSADAARTSARATIPWLILLRSAVPLRGLLFLPLIFQTLFMHAASWPGVCCFGIFASGLLVPHAHWLCTLPVSRRTLLAIAAATTSLIVMVPYTVSVAFSWSSHTSFRLDLINLVCMMSLCMSGLILAMAWGSYRVRLLPMWFRLCTFIPAAALIFLGPPAIALISLGHTSRRGLVDSLILHLSQRLPENPGIILVLGAIAFAAMFRLLEKLDAQAEWPELFHQVPDRELFGLN